MLFLGKQITQANDPLSPVSVERVYRALQNPDGEVARLQQRLQAIRMIDPAQYRRMKTQLPYIVCARFHPPLRRRENFAGTERFLVDLDHLTEYGLEAEGLKEKFKKDNRVELLFTSPGGDGLKLLFRLDYKITDAAYYSMFYRSFCLQLSAGYQLGGTVDLKTADVTRACFVSYDPLAYYQPDAMPVNPEEYLSRDNPAEGDQLQQALKEIQRQNEQESGKLTESNAPDADPLSDDILDVIRQKVGVRVKTRQEKYYEQPEQLKQLIPQIARELEEAGVLLEKDAPIDYGRQLRIKAGSRWAEINIFYGKRGVKVVGTTKTGSNRELCAMMTTYLKAIFENN